ncbi:DUF4272 domain-containing protein [Celeribacter indicus]|nr:DUF4272 domain-containing protein [Celeribacter indicus]SDX37195.1 protein of unknown function [Celeribacter indicus]
MGLGSFLFGRRTATAPAAARKARSEARLREEGVPVNPHLPPVGDGVTALARPEAEVVERALGAMIAAVKAETRDDGFIAKVIAQYRAEDVFTPLERAFIDDPAPSQEDCTTFVWRSEEVQVLLWAVRLLDALPYPAGLAPVPAMGQIMSRLGRDGLVAEARLRPLAEILDAADLTARYRWACANARTNRRTAPSNLDPGVVCERHYAFNWLIGSSGRDWDHITTDT